MKPESLLYDLLAFYLDLVASNYSGVSGVTQCALFAILQLDDYVICLRFLHVLFDVVTCNCTTDCTRECGQFFVFRLCDLVTDQTTDSATDDYART